MPKTKQQCEEIRNKMRTKILDLSLKYFARNGFAGTKISDLAKFIGIGQGTLYSYFSTKEELFNVIAKTIVDSNEQSLLELKNAPISATEKIIALSNKMLKEISRDTPLAYMFILNLQLLMESDNNSYAKKYEEKPNQILAQIIAEGQKDKTVVDGDPDELADLYWSMVHMLAIKKVFNNHHKSFEEMRLARLLLNDDTIMRRYDNGK